MNSIHVKLLAFFGLSYALTWIGYLCDLIWPSDNWPSMIPLGPIIAAPIVIGLSEGRAGLRAWWHRIIRFQAPGHVYAAAFFIPLAIIVASFAITIALGAELAPLPAYGFAEVLLMIVIVPFFGPIPEEPAFRGYALNLLQTTMSPLAASLWVGLGVIVWHLPLFLTGELPLTVLLPLAGVTVVYGWLYRTGGSVWPLVILHGQLNVLSALVTGPMMPGAADQSVYHVFLGIFYVTWAALIVWRCGPELVGRRPDPGMPLQV